MSSPPKINGLECSKKKWPATPPRACTRLWPKPTDDDAPGTMNGLDRFNSKRYNKVNTQNQRIINIYM